MKVSLVVVAHNEENTIGDLLSDLVAQEYPHNKVELVFVDSASTDGTKRVLKEFAQKQDSFENIQILDNPDKFLPQGCNVALRAYTGEVFLRVDAHARIPADFIQRNVEVLQSGEKVCGGTRPTVLQETNPWRETLLLAEESAFGSSPATYRRMQERCEVKSIFHGAYRREVFDRVGFYDERLLRTEDNDMSYRIRSAGYRFCFDPTIHSEQYVRSSLRRMLKQKEGNGYWIARMLYIQPKAVSLFHLVPLVFVLTLAAGLAVGLVVTWWPLVLLTALYVAANLGMTMLAIAKAEKRNKTAVALPIIFLLIHLSYGVGSVRGLIAGLFKDKGALADA